MSSLGLMEFDRRNCVFVSGGGRLSIHDLLVALRAAGHHGTANRLWCRVMDYADQREKAMEAESVKE